VNSDQEIAKYGSDGWTTVAGPPGVTDIDQVEALNNDLAWAVGTGNSFFPYLAGTCEEIPGIITGAVQYPSNVDGNVAFHSGTCNVLHFGDSPKCAGET
jgi:hypothetical protein